MDLTPGFTFPNDAASTWSLMIVLYPFITGLVAGAFIVSSLYHVGGKEELRPVARFALVAAFSFCAFAATPLLAHLHQPQRAFNIMITPHGTSAMAGFGFIYLFYLLLLAVEIWLDFRADIVAAANRNTGVRALFYRVLALNVLEVTPRSRELDRKLLHGLSMVGIPAACLLHGYVGFIFGAIKANPWWSTALMPVIFLMSAIVSGLAMLTVLYIAVSWWRGVEPREDTMRGMLKYLGIFLVVAVALEGLEILSKAYEAEAEWHLVQVLITEKLRFSFLIVQVAIGSVGALVLLAIANLAPLKARGLKWIGAITGVVVLAQVFAMRWNVVIGGQAISRSFRGFLEFQPLWVDREGILPALVILSLPFVLMAVIARVLPVWAEGEPGRQ